MKVRSGRPDKLKHLACNLRGLISLNHRAAKGEILLLSLPKQTFAYRLSPLVVIALIPSKDRTSLPKSLVQKRQSPSVERTTEVTDKKRRCYVNSDRTDDGPETQKEKGKITEKRLKRIKEKERKRKRRQRKKVGTKRKRRNRNATTGWCWRYVHLESMD